MEEKKKNTGLWVGFIIFIILAIIVTIIFLWWFIWRDAESPLKRVCTSNTQCLPNEICSNGICNAVSCTTNSQCNGVANGAGAAFCVRGYCQTPSCNSVEDCLVLGSDYACINFLPDIATQWINSACVKVGNTCAEDIDCYGGGRGLICIKEAGQTTGVCQQCAGNEDCGNLACVQGRCIECISNDQCDEGSVCGNGTCCTTPSYSVNSITGEINSCTQGELFDLCVDDSDCKSGHCIDLGNDIKVCGGGSSGTFTFSAGTTVNVGIPSEVAKYTCPLPGGPNDTTSTPFAVNGICSIYAALNQITGSACGRPSFCNNPSRANNLICNGNVTFENPYAISCEDATDCQSGYGCSNAGICGPGCDINTDCPSGFVCLSVPAEDQASGFSGICQYPVSKISCTTSQCTGDEGDNCPCPSGYGCDASSNICVWQTSEVQSGSAIPPPPPFIVDTICSRPATALPVGSTGNFISSYCVNGSCSTVPGWINSVCVKDEDCTFMSGDPSTNIRTSLICVNVGDVSVCQGNIGGISRT